MPFWWRRRRRPWFGTWRKRRYRKYKTKRRRRRWPRRKYRRTYRRRRGRRKKVKKKKQSIVVRQWQPDRIVRCKIKGFGSLVIGAEGSQYLCFTNEQYKWTLPKAPGGGLFGAEKFTLYNLYEQYLFRRNIWTKSNMLMDLCRYIRCQFTFYRHQKVDFILNYSRQAPFTISKYTYTLMHPTQLLLGKHKRIIPSKLTNPRGKLKHRVVIKPPKQMLSKWFFQQPFSTADLLQITASGCSLSYPTLGCCNENPIISLYYLNVQFFQESNWGQTHNNAFLPYSTISADNVYYYKIGNTSASYKITEFQFHSGGPTEYYKSIQRETGWFNPRILNTYKIMNGPTTYGYIPVSAARYNPLLDDGKGNEVYLVSIMGGKYDKPQDANLLFTNMPLWLAFFGLWNWIEKYKSTSFLTQHMFIIKSQYIQLQPTTATNKFFAFIDYSFMQGKNANDTYLTTLDKQNWYPTAWHQIESINAIVKCGPMIPKLDNDRDSTWELPYTYSFYFKWGGPETSDEQIKDPKTQPTYNVPDTIESSIQIRNPLKQSPESILHPWDYRRGIVTHTAFKRMCENIETDTDFQYDSETETPKKRKRVGGELPYPEEKTKKIKKCLLSLCESSTSQETQEETPNLLQLIHRQQQKQHNLKRNLLKILHEMKQKQRELQLQTGILE
nr:MAG: ORF1 [Torque teno midi virus]